jgi:diguanylate cyclase (GGDEF)-like protein
MDHITEGFILVDADDNYLSSNQAALEALPGIGALVKGESIFNAQGWPGELTRLETGSADFSVTRQNTRYFNTSVSPVIIRNGILQAKIILFRDISAQVTLMKQLENAAYTDALTGLYNRRHFFELAAMTIERSRRLNTSIYAAMIDLDFFKKVNDAYGHAAGDLVLKYAAEAIRQTVRSYDIVGRYGGEEFALILTDTELDGVQGLLERIRHNVAGSVIKYGEADIKITCSVGFARFSGEDTLETAIVKADRALYDVKENGRNQVKMY